MLQWNACVLSWLEPPDNSRNIKRTCLTSALATVHQRGRIINIHLQWINTIWLTIYQTWVRQITHQWLRTWSKTNWILIHHQQSLGDREQDTKMEKENKRQNVKPRGRLKGEQVKESVSVLFPVIVTICLSNPGKHFHFLTCKTYFRTNTSHYLTFI